jgi:drug/metabolite transporter (DMT)-like permease
MALPTTTPPDARPAAAGYGTAIALAAGACLVVGSSVAISDRITGYPHLGGQAIRYAVAALLLAVPALLRQRRAPVRVDGGDLARLVGVAATGLGGFNLCLLQALRHADPAVVGVVVGCAPLLLALGGALSARRPPAVRLILAALLVVAGAALVQGAGHAGPAGLAWATGALLGEVGFSLLAAPLLPRLGPLRLSAAVCALAVPMLVVGAVAVDRGGWLRVPSTGEATTLVYLATAVTAGAFLAWYSGLAVLGVERAGVLIGLMPVATLATAAAMAGRLPDPAQLFGVLVVAIGLAVGLGGTTTPSSREATAHQRCERILTRERGPAWIESEARRCTRALVPP